MFKGTFSLSQTNNVELARTLSWRENALFKEREKNVFVKPNEQCRTCSDIIMARKRTFRGTKKKVNSMPKWGGCQMFSGWQCEDEGTVRWGKQQQIAALFCVDE
ncbi:hypothetical protein HMPREF2955_06665 [Prevotella sp. HMSC073D09]|nr:hypothetical protein HMPREF2955_06665 [Prevotella sp. HMSC073D09]